MSPTGEPQPPGYWLYVMAGRLVHAGFGIGTIHSLVVVAAVASAVAAGLAAVAGRDLGGRGSGWPQAWWWPPVRSPGSADRSWPPTPSIWWACAGLIILAWRARPGSWHGLAAAVALGLLAGFRQSVVESFAVLVLIAVVASTRRWSRRP